MRFNHPFGFARQINACVNGHNRRCSSLCGNENPLEFDPLCRPATRGLHHGQELKLHKQAGYICADQTTHDNDAASNLAADHTLPTATAATAVTHDNYVSGNTPT
jgi:hypothetical protein